DVRRIAGADLDHVRGVRVREVERALEDVVGLRVRVVARVEPAAGLDVEGAAVDALRPDVDPRRGAVSGNGRPRRVRGVRPGDHRRVLLDPVERLPVVPRADRFVAGVLDLGLGGGHGHAGSPLAWSCGDVGVFSGKWQALRWSGACSSSAGLSTRQRSWAFQQREAKTQPAIGAVRSGGSPSSMIRLRPRSTAGSGSGTAESSAIVYGCCG